MHQTVSSVAVHGGLVIAPDGTGRVHCFDARTGKRYWTHDTRSYQRGDPLVADGKVYISSDEGLVTVLELSKTRKVLSKHEMGHGIYAPAVFANGTLYVLTEQRLYAIGTPR